MAILRKIKERLKRFMKKKEPKQIKKTISPEAKKEFLGTQEMAVERAKFYTGEIAPAPKLERIMPRDLPSGYGQDKIVLQVRDPWWLHAYWEVTAHTWDKLKNAFKNEFYQAKRVLRVYDISHIIFDGKNAHRFFEVEINEHANNWYIDTKGPGRSWCVDLGLLLSEGRFIGIVRSNTVHTPLEGSSWLTDEEWMVPEEMFARLYGMGFGFGRSSPVGKLWQERIKQALFSGVLASPGITSLASPVKVAPERKFWLVVNTELIVYGATVPNATVSVQGKKINLRPDGSFSLRFALPDGKQVIPVKAVSADHEEERTITPVVTKETK